MSAVKRFVWCLAATIVVGVLGVPALALGVAAGIVRRGFVGGLEAADELLEWWTKVGEA